MSSFPFELDPFQTQAIAELDAERSVLVSAPTGTGKTVIADHMVAEALAGGRMVVYTAPVKALSNQKFRDYVHKHGEASVGLVTGDLVIRRDAPCLVMTTEILRNMLLTDDLPADLSHVILDEIHFLDDRERGTTWEEVLIYLPNRIQVLGLSATLSNLEDFAAWLGHVRGQEVAVIREETRAVPLQLHMLDRQGGLQEPSAYDKAYEQWRKQRKTERGTGGRRGGGRYGSRGRGGHRGQRGRSDRHGGRGGTGAHEQPATRHMDVFRTIHSEHTPYLYFVFNRRFTERFASGLAERRPHLLSYGEWQECKAELDAFEADWGTDVLEPKLRKMYEQGVGFHHAGLHVQLKALVERLYERKLIRVLYCTSTFALGVNMPARTVVFDGLSKYDGRGVNPLSVREFMQMAGRAGRRGMDEVGHVVVRMDPWDYGSVRGQLGGYRSGSPEKVRSSFNLSFHSVVHLLQRHPQDRIRTLVESSFLAWQQAERSRGALKQCAQMESGIRSNMGRILGKKDPLPPANKLPPPLRKAGRKLERLREQAMTGKERCWQDFQARVFFLQSIGYLGDDLSFHAGAQALMHIQMSEIFVTELVLEGVLEDLEPNLLFGLLCGVVQNLPRGAHLLEPPDRALRALAKEVSKVLHSPPVREAERLTDIGTDFCPELIPLGVAWAEGEPLAEIGDRIDSGIDISGDLVGAFRRARDLCSQLIELWKDDRDRADELWALLDATGRDEVEVVG
jgi:ATP-dependent RNA helicase HelY